MNVKTRIKLGYTIRKYIFPLFLINIFIHGFAHVPDYIFVIMSFIPFFLAIIFLSGLRCQKCGYSLIYYRPKGKFFYKMIDFLPNKCPHCGVDTSIQFPGEESKPLQ